MSTEPAPEITADVGRRGRPLHRTWAQRVAKAERAAARERERREVLGAELRACRAEVRRLRRLLAGTEAGRMAALQAQLDRAREELVKWRAGRR